MKKPCCRKKKLRKENQQVVKLNNLQNKKEMGNRQMENKETGNQEAIAEANIVAEANIEEEVSTSLVVVPIKGIGSQKPEQKEKKESKMNIIKDHEAEEEVVDSTTTTNKLGALEAKPKKIMIKVKQERERQDHTEEEVPVGIEVIEEAVIEGAETEVVEAT